MAHSCLGVGGAHWSLHGGPKPEEALSPSWRRAGSSQLLDAFLLVLDGHLQGSKGVGDSAPGSLTEGCRETAPVPFPRVQP